MCIYSLIDYFYFMLMFIDIFHDYSLSILVVRVQYFINSVVCLVGLH